MKDNKSEQNKVKATSIFEKLLKFLLSKILKFKFSEFILKPIISLYNKIITLLKGIYTNLKNMLNAFSTTSAKVHTEIKSNGSDGNETMNPLHPNNATNADELSTNASASTASAPNSTAKDQLDELTVNKLDNNAVYFTIPDVLKILNNEQNIISGNIEKFLPNTTFVRIEMLPNNGFGVTLLDSNLNKVIINEETKKILDGFNNQMLTNTDAVKMIKDAVTHSTGNDDSGLTVSVPRSIDGGGVKKHYTTYETYKISLDKACKTGDISIVKNLLDGALGEKNGEEILPGFKSFLETYKVPDGVNNDDIKIKIDAEKFKEEQAGRRGFLR